MYNAHTDYERRARELMLNPEQTRAFIALSNHADKTGHCPSCNNNVGRYESDRLTHARTCAQLKADAS